MKSAIKPTPGQSRLRPMRPVARLRVLCSDSGGLSVSRLPSPSDASRSQQLPNSSADKERDLTRVLQACAEETVIEHLSLRISAWCRLVCLVRPGLEQARRSRGQPSRTNTLPGLTLTGSWSVGRRMALLCACAG